MAGLHRDFRGNVSRESVPADSVRADHASRGLLCAAGSAGSGARGVGRFAGHSARRPALVWDRSLDQRRTDRSLVATSWSLDRHQC